MYSSRGENRDEVDAWCQSAVDEMQTLISDAKTFLKLGDKKLIAPFGDDEFYRNADLSCQYVPRVVNTVLHLVHPDEAFPDWAINWLGNVFVLMMDPRFVSKCNHLTTTALQTLPWVVRNAQVRLLQIDRAAFPRGIHHALVECIAVVEDLQFVLKKLRERDDESRSHEKMVKSASANLGKAK